MTQWVWSWEPENTSATLKYQEINCWSKWLLLLYIIISSLRQIRLLIPEIPPVCDSHIWNLWYVQYMFNSLQLQRELLGSCDVITPGTETDPRTGTELKPVKLLNVFTQSPTSASVAEQVKTSGTKKPANLFPLVEQVLVSKHWPVRQLGADEAWRRLIDSALLDVRDTNSRALTRGKLYRSAPINPLYYCNRGRGEGGREVREVRGSPRGIVRELLSAVCVCRGGGGGWSCCWWWNLLSKENTGELYEASLQTC